MKTQLIRIEEKDYLLSFDINTLCLMEASGLDVMTLANLGESVSFTMIRKLFYFGLMKFNKKGLTEEKAGLLMSEFISEGNSLEELMEKIMVAFQEGLGIKVVENQESPMLEEGK